MTSEVEALKTNEFLRRRKLRIQQVREQSKDIAKKIRQRASAEQFKNLVELDSTKGREYLEQQDKLIKKLELLHANSISNVGVGHRNAAEVEQENKQGKIDLSKRRAREAVAELRRKKQEQLDLRKRLLERRLQAREIANEISREKSCSAVTKLSKASVQPSEQAEQPNKPASESVPEQTSDLTQETDKNIPARTDMATQSDFDVVPNEWESQIPALALAKDDEAENSGTKNPEIEIEKPKRLNLFALSDDMPSSLCGSRVSIQPPERTKRETLNLVSEFIQNRDLRLRDYDAGISSKKPNEELESIKQTILRTRAARLPGSLVETVHVADEQVVPVPSWHAEPNCSPCTQRTTTQPSVKQTPRKNNAPKPKKTVKSECNNLSTSVKMRRNDITPTPVLRDSSPFRRSKVIPGTFSAKPTHDKASNSKGDSSEIILGKKRCDNIEAIVEKKRGDSSQLNLGKKKGDGSKVSVVKKNSVTMYNHSTRDVRDIPYEDKRFVIRDQTADEDAYSQAMKEASFEKISKNRDHQKKLPDMRNKIAMSKQSVEKEFRDTMTFLNSLPKERCTKAIRSAYKDDFHQEFQKEKRQRKLQHEFKKAQRECQHSQTKKVPLRTKMQATNASDEDFDAQDSQYSWMPVPESDGGLAIHIIPTKVKENKCGSAVRFSKIDSYHEYRSRHRHTPPTKDTHDTEKSNGATTELTEDTDGQTSTSSESETSSVENLQLKKEPSTKKSKRRLSDEERIIVYKILESKAAKRKMQKKGSKISVSKSLSFVSKECQAGQNREVDDHGTNVPERQDRGAEIDKWNQVKSKGSKHDKSHLTAEKLPDTIMSFEHIQEGVYKTVNEKGDNISAMQICETTHEKNTPKADISSMYRHQQNSVDRGVGNIVQEPVNSTTKKQTATMSSMSFKTASHEKSRISTSSPSGSVTVGEKLNSDFMHIIDDKCQDSGKFYVGASGFRKDDNYELVIQLRKMDKIEPKSEINKAPDNKTVACQPSLSDMVPGTGDINKALPEEKRKKTYVENGVGTNECDTKQTQVQTEGAPQYVDRSVDVPFQESFQIAGSPALPTEEKLRTSVSVQTTIDSSETRLPFFRMSSSASTSYLSPPEVVLPQFLKHGRRKISNDSDFYFPFTRRRVEPNKHSKDRQVKSSSPKRNAKLKIVNTSLSPSRFSKSAKVIKTPPNTERSIISDGSNKQNSNIRKKKSKNSHKCTKHSTDNLRAYIEKVQKKAPPVPPTSKTCTVILKKKCRASGKGDLSPIIKWYVDKLLAMNKEGLQTIEVLHQNCSEVTTPGSSVVDDPCNIKNNKHSLNTKISLEQLKFAIAAEILEQYEKINNQETSRDTRESNRNSKTEAKKVGKFTLRFPRQKIHKVKSLNISRSLLPKMKASFLKKVTKVSSLASNSDDLTNSVKVNRRSKSSTEQSIRSPDSISVKKSAKTCIIQHEDTEENQNMAPKEQEIKTSKKQPHKTSQNISTQSLKTSSQSNVPIDEEIKFIKEAEDKLQNMAKIADLTEKCSKRLSNLAKFLEEVRKNKLPYTQVSETPSEPDLTDQASDTQLMATSYEPVVEIKEKSPELPAGCSAPDGSPTNESQELSVTQTLMQVLKNFSPKPIKPKYVFLPAKESQTQSPSAEAHNVRTQTRSKPPPAFPRCLRRIPELEPHELSTVLEVDSPMSKHKGQSVRIDTSERAGEPVGGAKSAANTRDENSHMNESSQTNPDILPPRQFEETKIPKVASDHAKMQMMDLNQFNEIMLQPFISIQEYAKQRNITTIEEGSNIESAYKDDGLNDELSSLHSDGSLPDVIAELLKRNIISEPFKFETISNINSTSSDSTLSVLAISKTKNDKKSAKLTSNKENAGDSSDTLSLSSNPDLENAFKKLGMGWASSTLKKTKEHLALSSSSNTSSSSLSQYKFKSLKNNDIPVLVTDSMSSIKNAPSNNGKKRSSDSAKNSLQQASIAASMTVRKFLTDELSKRITFGERPNETPDEFVSLYETKLPEDMTGNNMRVIYEERSIDSNPRARTSTPVQLYKSTNYHSSSSSNLSNGLCFSNAEDLSSVKGTSNSLRNHSTSEKEDLTVPNFSLRTRKGISDGSKSED